MSAAIGRLPWFVPLTLAAFVPLSAAAAVGLLAERAGDGIVLEEVGEGALQAVGLRAGDRVVAWESAPATGPVRGLESVFDWYRLRIEESPRAPVRLWVERDGKRFSVVIGQGLGEATVRPVLPPLLLRGFLGGAQRLDRGERPAALAAWHALEGELPVEPWTWRCWLLIRLGEAHAQGGAADRAEAAYRAALAVAASPEARALVWERLGQLQEEASSWEEAAVSFASASAMWRQISGDGLGLAYSLWNEARIAQAQDRLTAANELLKSATRIEEELAPGSATLAGTLNDLGTALARMGHLTAAEDAYGRSASIRRRLKPGTLVEAEVLNNLGILAFWRGDLELADTHHRRALEIRRSRAPASREVAQSLGNLALVCWHRGELDEAEELATQGLRIEVAVAPGSVDVSGTLQNLAGIALDRGRLEEAVQRYEAALEILRRHAEGSLAVAIGQHNLGNVALERRQLEEAEARYREAQRIFRRLAPASLDAAANAHQLARVELARGRLDRAERGFSEALAIRQRLAPGSAALAETLRELGQLARRRGSRGEAVRLLALSVETLEAQVDKLGGSSMTRARYRAQHRRAYSDYLDVLVEAGELALAFGVLERSRARSFLSMLAERRLAPLEIPPELEAERQAWRRRYERTQDRLLELSSDEDEAQVAALHAEHRRLLGERRALQELLTAALPRLAALEAPKPLDLAAAEQNLDPGTTLLAYHVAPERTVLFVVKPQRALTVEVLTVGESELRRRVERFRTLIREARPEYPLGSRRMLSLLASGRRLFDDLVAPAAAAIAAGERLLVLPDGPLLTLPFAALVRDLPDAGLKGARPGRSWEYLVEWRPLHTAASATVYAELRRGARPLSEEAELAAFGDPFMPESDGGRGGAGAGAWDALPGSRSEVEAIAALYLDRARVFLGRAASKTALKALGSRVDILHLATHGILNERLPLSSGLLLSPTEAGELRASDGWLRAWEILEELRLDASLVVLSACDSARGQELAGEGLIGLTRAFQHAGASSVVASQWRVADHSTAELMVRFHRRLLEGLSKDRALRAAQLDFIRRPVLAAGEAAPRDVSSPYHWAAFQLIGDWR